jgi:hypothetical protein
VQTKPAHEAGFFLPTSTTLKRGKKWGRKGRLWGKVVEKGGKGSKVGD